MEEHLTILLFTSSCLVSTILCALCVCVCVCVHATSNVVVSVSIFMWILNSYNGFFNYIWMLVVNVCIIHIL